MANIDLKQELKADVNEFIGKTFSDPIVVSFTDLKKISRLVFKDCTFKETMIFEGIDDPGFYLTFHNCWFESDVRILRCEFKEIQISHIKNLTSIEIYAGIHDVIRISSNDEPISGDLNIDCRIGDKLDCSNLNFSKGNFTLSLRNKITDSFDFTSSFKNATFYLCNFSNSYLGSDADFRNFTVITTAFFDQCDFKKIHFSDANLGIDSYFNDCKFHSFSGFENCTNIERTRLYYRSCLFKSFPHFNNSKFNHFEITHTTFLRKASFDGIEVNTLKLYQVSFHEEAFFDDISIHDIGECDKTSLRTVKQELQKTENKIDFNRFRVYEFNAYRKDIRKKLTLFQKDKKFFLFYITKEPLRLQRDVFVLWISDIVSEYGTDWKKALKFTLFWGFVIYSIFFICENYSYPFDWKNWQQFPIGLIRFFLVTDFYSPLAKDRVYLESFASWIPFIAGKIVIAFGIYEMIQSFRKFRA